MEKFFLFTRGRTGSTAIIDEIGTLKHIRTAQELFLKFDYRSLLNQFKNLMEHYDDTMLPYELWKPKYWIFKHWPELWLLSRIPQNLYLSDIEQAASEAAARAFGFKILSHQFDETPDLEATLLRRRYKAIYLTRNIPRQVISGMIANARGVYNTQQNFDESAQFEIDLDEFRRLVEWEQQAVCNDLIRLSSSGFEHITISYEEFTNSRSELFHRITNFLQLPASTPASSNYAIMIKDLEYTVTNYEAVIKLAAEMDIPLT